MDSESFARFVVFGFVILIIAGPIFLVKRYTKKKWIAKLSNMPVEQRKMEIMKLQSKAGKYDTSHVLHLILSLISVGIWVPFWILVAISNSGQRKKIEKLMDDVTDTPLEA